MATAVKQSGFWKLRPGERRLILLLGDFLVAFLALFFALYFWSVEPDEWLKFSLQFLIERPPLWFYLLPFLWILFQSGLYDVRKVHKFSETITGIGISILLSGTIYLLVFFLSQPNTLPRLGVGLFFIAAAIFTILWRIIYLKIFTAPRFQRRVLIVGAGNSGKVLVDFINQTNPPPFHLVGLVDDDKEKIGNKIGNFPIFGPIIELDKLVIDNEISDIVFSISGELDPVAINSLLQAEETGVEITSMPVMYEELTGRVPIYLLKPDWLLRSFIDDAHVNRFYEIGKRFLDIIGGLIGVIFFLFLYPFIGLAIVIDNRGPIIYSQIRLGKNGKYYEILKFRTMFVDAEKNGNFQPAEENDQRITVVGRILRKSHLDELPQFINVLKGEMSLVGPRSERPMIVETYQKHIPFYRGRLLVKPGITGWAQVNYGYASTIEENSVKLEYDLYYIKHRDLLMDLSTMLLTISSVIGLRGR
ncbi:MAG TPA: sugar transferase [Anaerolineaceae bacterium]|nr:sugar transferase [Anaerolineaceae bacterium]